MEKQEETENPSEVDKELLEGSNTLGNDSNSLEPGEVVEEKTPPRATSLEDENEGKLSTSAAVDSISGGSSSTTTTPKSVLGKEKAKQKLKAMGIQKKIQMESKNTTTPQKRKKFGDKGNSSNSKKDKPPTPHEKAKLTKEEIEKLKEKQDCAIPCLYYDETMIHHIRADCPGEKPAANKVEPCLTASLEAIKNYEDHEEVPVTSGTTVGAEKGGLKRLRNVDDSVESYKQTRRKLFHANAFGSRIRDKSRRRMSLKSERLLRSSYRLQKRKNLGEQGKPESQLPRAFQILGDLPPCREDGLMYTKAKPPLSFAFNINATALHRAQSPRERKRKKSKKKSKDNQESGDSGKRRKKRSKQSRPGVSDTKKKSKKVKKKKITEGKDERKAKKSKKGKNRKNKKEKLLQSRGALSFHLDEFYPVEDTESFPLCKDGITAVDEAEEDDLALENKLKSLQEELNKKSPSPDTDEYMANWEEEEDFVLIPRSKDCTPMVGPDDNLKASDEEAGQQQKEELVQSRRLEGDNENEKCDSDRQEDEEEIRDGLGTPIFLNPSPPAELANVMQEEERSPPSTTPEIKMNSPEQIHEDNEKPRLQSSPLFGMQVIYEQFIQSVNEAGIELSLEQRHSKEKEDSAATSPPDEENSFTPNTSPGRSSVAAMKSPEPKELTPPSQPLNDDKSGSESISSTPSPSSPSESSSSSSSSTTSSAEEVCDTEDDVEPSTSKKKRKRMKKAPLSCDPQLSVLSPEDSKKLHSLQKRWRMLKSLQEQSDAMDDEDIQCLLGLEKLIEAEKGLLMRKYELSERSETMGEDGRESDITDSGVSSTLINTSTISSDDTTKTPPRDESETSDNLSKIFDANRETIRLMISPKVQKSAPSDRRSDEEVEDFTEKLLKPLKDFSEMEEDDRGSKENRARKHSPSGSRSPEFRKGTVRKGRSLSISPDRRSRAQFDRSRRWRRRQYSPPPRHLRLDSPISRKRHELRRSRERKRSLSPLVRRRSRSPYSRRFSRSPPFRPPSPTSPPPSSRDSRSPSRERGPCLENPPSSAHHYLWSDDSSSHYYPGYYYPSSPNHPSTNQTGQQLVRPYPGGLGYTNYSQYNAYPGDYGAMTGYANNYGNEYISSEPMNSYSRIPVINSTGANYYYNEFGGAEPSQSHDILASRSTSKQNSTKSSTFVVQKGNVLEIVPTPVIPKQERMERDDVEVSSESQNNSIDIKSATENAEEENQQPYIKKEKIEEKRKKRKPGEFMSWEDEVAKRHIMSAVLRLNKEGDGVLRGILCNKTNPDVQNKEKKKVLFADGIPPGKCSSTSDEESPPSSSTRKRSKKKWRRGENKENESSMLDTIDAVNEFKVDPELENAPPPPPPPGSPPPNLEQPILIRSPSPEQLLYFHYDVVVNSMYVSQLATPIPPRLLNRGVQQILPAQASNLPKMNENTVTNKENEAAKENSNEDEKETVPKESVRSEEPNDSIKERCKEVFGSTPESSVPETSSASEHQNTPPFTPPAQPQFEILPLVVTKCLTPPPVKNQAPNPNSADSRSLSPIISGFSGFNRPPPRPAVSVLRPDFSVPPPSAQIQPMLSHPSIPFGPRPPGGSANFNRNVPPPFNPPQQHAFRTQFNNPPNREASSPSPGANAMQSAIPTSPISLFRPSTFGNSTQGYSPSQAVPVRATGMCPSFRSPANFDSHAAYSSPNVIVSPSFTPSPAVNTTSLLGNPPQFHGNNNPSQYHPNNNNSPLMSSSTSPHNFNTNAPPNVRTSHPFNSSGMLSQMQHHRPNLGFPRSFGPLRPPPSPQHGSGHQQHMYGQPPMSVLSPNQMHPNMSPYNTQRPMYPSPGGVHHFFRSENNQRMPPNAGPPLVQHQQHQSPPYPGNGSPIMRAQSTANTNSNL